MLNNIFVYIILGNSYSTYNIILIMTGDEYFSLRRGNHVTVETSFSYFTKGQVLKVEYIDSIHQQVFLRDTSKPLGDQVKIVDTFFILNNFVVGGELPEKKNNNKVFELPFAIGDKVWFIRNDKVHEGTVIECNVSINQDGVQIYYSAIYTSKYNHEEEAERIISNRFFKTKTELLKSL